MGAFAAQVERGLGGGQAEEGEHAEGLAHGAQVDGWAFVSDLVDEAEVLEGERPAAHVGQLEGEIEQPGGLGLGRDDDADDGGRAGVEELRPEGAEDLLADPAAEPLDDALLVGAAVVRRGVDFEIAVEVEEGLVLGVGGGEIDLVVGEEGVVGVLEAPVPVLRVLVVGDLQDRMRRVPVPVHHGLLPFERTLGKGDGPAGFQRASPLARDHTRLAPQSQG